ncbi:MAG: hypothetical protein K2X93_10815 [Candidatus Obscuribacterales bacterium]|nr:hypothetical protein [Candidatus Obscuribacterales bacterium]
MRDYPGQQSRNNDAQPDCDTPSLVVSATADQVNSITDDLKSSVSTSTAKSLPQLDILTGDSTDGAPAPSDLATVSTDDILPDIGFIDFSVDGGGKDDEKTPNFTKSDTNSSQDLSANLKDNDFISAGSPGDNGKVGADVTHTDDKTGKQSVDLNPANPAPNCVVANFERTGERIVPLALEHYPNSTRWLLAQGLPQIGEYFDALDSNAAAQALSALQQDAARDPKLQQQFRVLSLLDAELRTHEATWFLQFGGKTVPADTIKQHLSEGVTDLLRLAPPDFAQKIKSKAPKDVDEYLKSIADPVAREAAETLTKYAKSGTLADHLPDALSTIDTAHKIENQESHKAAADFLKNPYDAPARSRAINTLKDVDRAGKINSLSEEVRDLEALDLALKYIQSGDSKEAQTNAIELLRAAGDGNEFAKRILVKMAGKHDFKEMIEKARTGDRDMLASMKMTWSPEEALGELRAKDGYRELGRNPTPEKLEELLKQLSKDCTTAGVDLKRFLAVEQALRELEAPETSTKALKHLQCEALEDNPHARAALSIILSEDRNLVGRDKMYVPDLADHTVQQRNEIKKQAVETLSTLLEKGESLSESEFTAIATALSSRDLYATGGKALRESIESTVDRACNQPSNQLDPASVFKYARQTESALSGISRAITTGGANHKATGELYLRAAGSVNNKFSIHDGQTAGREFGKQIDVLCSSRNNSDATITILAGLTRGVGEQNTSDNANPEHKRIHPDSKIKSLDHGTLSYKASEALIKAASQDPKIRDAVMATLSTNTAGKDSSTLDEKTLAATAVLNINDIPDYVHKSLQRSVLTEKTDPMGAVDAMLKLGKAVSDQDADRVVQILLETGHKDPQKAAEQLLRMADTTESTYVKSVAVLALGAKNWQGANLEVKGSEEFMRLLRIKEANKDNPTIELAIAKLTHGAGQPLSIAATLKEKGCQLDDQALHALVDKASQKYSTEQMQQIIHQMVMYNALPETLRSEFSGSHEKLDEGQTISLGGRHIDATTVNSSEHLRVLLLGGKDLQLAESVPVLKAVRDLSADAVNKLPLDFAAKLRGGKVASGEAIPASVLANCGVSQEELSHLKAEHRQLLEGVIVFAPVSQSVQDLANKTIPASEFNLLTDAVRAKLNDGKTDLLQNGASMSLSGKTLDADTVNLLTPKLRQYLTGSQAPLQQGRVLLDLSTIKINAKQFNDLTPGQRKGLTSTSQGIDSLSLLGQMANHTLDAKDSRIAFLASPDFEKKIVAARDVAVKKKESLELDLGNLVSSKNKKLSELARHTTDGMSTWESITSIGHDLEKSVWKGLPTVLTDDSQFEKTQRDLVKAIGFTETALSSDVLDMQRTVARLKGLDIATKAFEYSTANAKGDRNQADECALNTALHYGLGGINNSSEMKTGLLATGEGINAGVFSRRGLPGEKAFETLLQKDYSIDPTGSAATVDALDLLSALRPTEHLSKRNDTSVMRNVALQHIDSTPAFVKLSDLNQRVFADLSVLQKEIEAGVNGDKCEDFFKDTQQRAARIKEALKTLDQKDFDQLRELRDSIQDRLGVKQDQPDSITDAESRKALKDRATAINSILENLDREQQHLTQHLAPIDSSGIKDGAFGEIPEVFSGYISDNV